MKSIKHVLGLPILSEKSLAGRAVANQYVFRVPPSTNKAEI